MVNRLIVTLKTVSDIAQVIDTFHSFLKNISQVKMTLTVR